MPRAPHINLLPGCRKPANCRAKPDALCARCVLPPPSTDAAPVERNAAILRIELPAARRRHLGDMAREAGVPADVLATRLLTALIDDDAAAHGAPRVTEKETIS